MAGSKDLHGGEPADTQAANVGKAAPSGVVAGAMEGQDGAARVPWPPDPPAGAPYDVAAAAAGKTDRVGPEPPLAGPTHGSLPAAAIVRDPAAPEHASAPVSADQVWSGPEQAEPAGPARVTPSPDAGARLTPSLWSKSQPEEAAHGSPTAVADAPGGPRRSAAPPPDVPLPWAKQGTALAYLRIALRAAAALVLTIAAGIVLLTIFYRWVDPPASTLMLAQRLTGTEIEQKWVPLDRISAHLVQAVILSEDGAFCRHRGVDWSAVEEAIESSRDGMARGGSTITMQVVKNLFLWPSRSYVRKAIEIPLAYLVELFWPKRRIMEIYLNIAEWGEGVFGAEAAAQHHFGKSASRLTAEEAALLAVALPNPIERQAGEPGPLARRLASNLLARMRAVRTTMGCVRVYRAGG